MKVISVMDESFAAYGKVIEGYNFAELLNKLEEVSEKPADHVEYVPSVAALEALPVFTKVQDQIYGGFNRGQSLVLIAVRPWNGVIEDPAAVMGIPDQETPCGNSPTGVENRPPHQFRAQGILTDAVITGLIEFPECGGVFLGYGFELQHKTHIPCQNYEARVAAAGRPRERRAEQILMIENIFLEMGREFLDAGRKI